MKYKTLILERGCRGGRFKKPVTIRVPERQTLAEKKLLQYIWESLSTKSSLIQFTVNNVSTMKLARHLLFNRTGSQLSLYAYIDQIHRFCRWIQAEPDQLARAIRQKNQHRARLSKELVEMIEDLIEENPQARARASQTLLQTPSAYGLNSSGDGPTAL